MWLRPLDHSRLHSSSLQHLQPPWVQSYSVTPRSFGPSGPSTVLTKIPSSSPWPIYPWIYPQNSSTQCISHFWTQVPLSCPQCVFLFPSSPTIRLCGHGNFHMSLWISVSSSVEWDHWTKWFLTALQPSHAEPQYPLEIIRSLTPLFKSFPWCSPRKALAQGPMQSHPVCALPESQRAKTKNPPWTALTWEIKLVEKQAQWSKSHLLIGYSMKYTIQ